MVRGRWDDKQADRLALLELSAATFSETTHQIKETQAQSANNDRRLCFDAAEITFFGETRFQVKELVCLRIIVQCLLVARQ